VDPVGPFAPAPTGGTIDTESDFEVAVTYTQEDEASHMSWLVVSADPEETLNVELSGEYDDGGVSEVPAANFERAFGPAYPNPFAGSTTIEYTLPEASEVTLQIYSSNRAVVEVLVAAQQPAGSHAVSWDGTNAEGSDLPAGVYGAKLMVGDWEAWGSIEVLR
jgi:hypothetical protein